MVISSKPIFVVLGKTTFTSVREFIGLQSKNNSHKKYLV